MKIGETKKYYFPVNDVTVIVELFPNGEYGAWRDQIDDGEPVKGWGRTPLEAIADMVDSIGRVES